MNQKLRQVLEEASPILPKLEIKPQYAFPLGNGDMTCLLMGNENEFIIHLTKNDVWDKRVFTEDDVEIISNDEIHQLAMNTEIGERTLKVNLDSNTPLNGKADSYTRPYPCPVICAKLKVSANMAGIYHRLNLSSATVESYFSHGVVKSYISYNYNLFVMEGLADDMLVELIPVEHLDADKPQCFNIGDCEVLLYHMPADLDVKDYYYAVGINKRINGKLIASIAVSYDENVIFSVVDEINKYVDNDSLYSEHLESWNDFWSCSSIEIENKLLQNVWYRNTYALGSVAKSGKVSPGLYASLISDTPMWHGDYHTNYNFQSIYWGAYITNHCNLSDAYDDIIISHLKRAQWIAKKVWNVDGAFFPHVLYYDEPDNPDDCKSKNGRQYFHHVWSRTVGVSAMTVQNLLMHWYHDPSPKLLNKIYPVLRDSADFYLNLGSLSEAFTVSPEHWGVTPKCTLNYECTFDIALIKYLINGCIKAAEFLDIDLERRNAWRKYLDNMPAYPTTKDYENALKDGNEFLLKQIAECSCYEPNIPYEDCIISDIKFAPPTLYNIPVPILPVFPVCDIDLSSSKYDQDLVKNTLKYMKTNGNNDFIMGAITRVRLRTEDMNDYLLDRIQSQLMPNGFLTMSREPDHFFNTCGIYTEMFGITLAISEQLLQSNKGYIRVFPSLSKCQNCTFNHLLAEGGVLVSAEMIDGHIV